MVRLWFCMGVLQKCTGGIRVTLPLDEMTLYPHGWVTEVNGWDTVSMADYRWKLLGSIVGYRWKLAVNMAGYR